MAPPAAPARLLYLDHLRGCLMVLVIVHHVAITYGSIGSWYYIEKNSLTAWQTVLSTFCAANQFFFMGLFFFLAAFFSPPALKKKGAREFVRDRFVRLGIPLLFYAAFITPLMMELRKFWDPEFSWSAWFTGNIPLVKGFSPGPLWFVETLLIFSLTWVCVRSRRESPPRASSPLQAVHLVVFAVALAAASFVVRLAFPAGVEVWHLQLAFFPQYVLLFAAGIAARTEGWLENSLSHFIPVCAAVFAIGVLGLFFLLWDLLVNGSPVPPVAGGWHARALLLCALEGMICPSAIVLLLHFFKQRLAEPNRFFAMLARNAYGAYFLHPPIAVGAALLLSVSSWGPPLRFPLCAMLAVAGSVAASEICLRRAPGAREIFG